MSDEVDNHSGGQAVARPAVGPGRTGDDWKEIRQRFKDLVVVFFGGVRGVRAQPLRRRPPRRDATGKDARALLASEKEFLGQLRARRHTR